MAMMSGDIFNFIEQNGFTHTTQPQEHLRVTRSANQCTLNSNSGVVDDRLSTGQFRRLVTCTWRKGVSYRIHRRLAIEKYNDV